MAALRLARALAPASFIFLLALIFTGSQLTAQSPELLPSVHSITVGGLHGDVWPGRFNSDGITDLVGVTADEPRRLVVVMGVGDGRFSAPIVNRWTATPLAVADFNRDGRTDLVGREHDATDSPALYIFAGNGDGTFAEPDILASNGSLAYTFAVATDIDGDNLIDVIAADEDQTLYVFRGHGDLTFDPARTMTSTGSWPHGAVVADFNRDTLPDLAVANRYGPAQVTVFLNRGGLLFAPTDIVFDRSSADVAAGDLNGDTFPDLVVAVREGDDPPHRDGFAYVLFGDGNGAFGLPAAYEVARGANAVVIGDFTRDGKVDVATLNESWQFMDDCVTSFKGGNSVSIVPGNGDGTFGRATSFALGSQSGVSTFDELHPATSLNTNDVNGDSQKDLIISGGIVFESAAPRVNRPPVAYAGSDRTQVLDREIALFGEGTDPDGHLLSFSWTHSGGMFVLPASHTCLTVGDYGNHTFTMRADDGNGAAATDSVNILVRETGVPPTVNVTRPAAGEVIAPGAPYTIRWEQVDDTWLTAAFVEASVDDGATYTPIDECQSRAAPSTECVWSNPGPLSNRAIIRVRVYDSDGWDGSDTSGTFTIAGEPRYGPLPPRWQHADIGRVGLPGDAGYWNGSFQVKGSGTDIWGTADAFHFAYVELPYDGDLTVRVSGVDGSEPWTKVGLMIRGSLAPGARHESVFATTGKGIAYQRRRSANGITLHTPLASYGTGAPVWFRISRRSDFVHVFASTDGLHWGNFGSATWGPGTTYVGLAVSSHNNALLATGTFDNVTVNVRGRNIPSTVEITTPTDGTTFDAPADVYVRIEATDPDYGIKNVNLEIFRDSQWVGYLQDDFYPYETTLRRMQPGTYPMRARVVDNEFGITYSETVTFRVSDGSLPGVWSNRDIGAVGAAGSFADGDPITVEGSGADIWGTADEFHYAYQQATGDFEMVARVASIENVHAWVKAGLMFRETLEPGSRHVSVFATPGKGTAFQRRPSPNGVSVHTPARPAQWLRLVRRGDAFSAYFRHLDGQGWQFVGSDTVPMASTIHVGFAVGSHVDGTLATAAFDNVSLGAAPAWQSGDIGAVARGGTFATNGTTFTVEGSGADIWGTADEFRYTYVPLGGDGEMIARVSSVENTHAWMKAGVMMRSALTPGSWHFSALVTPGKGIVAQKRDLAGGTSVSGPALAGSAPAWVKVVRTGPWVEAFTSVDGLTWRSLMGTRYEGLDEQVYVGLAVTSHADGTLATATFDSVSIEK